MAEPLNMYEFAYVVDGVLSEEKIKDVVRRVGEFVKENGCEIIAVDELGVKRLAYPIKKRNNGYYVFMYINGPGSFIARLERAVEINDQILRFVTLKYDAKMKRHFEKQRSVTAAPVSESESA